MYSALPLFRERNHRVVCQLNPKRIFIAADNGFCIFNQDIALIAIGTAHGFYKGKPRLAFERLTQIREAVDIPLVLHGSSGVPDEDVQRAVSMGVCKVNFATELRAAYTQAVRDCLAHDAALYDPKKYGGPAREAVISLVRHRIKICAGKVGLIAPL